MGRNRRGGTAAVVAAAGGLGLSLAALSLGAVPLLASLGDRASNKRKRGSPLSPSRWYASQDRDGRVGDAVADVLARVADGGVEPMLRCEVWPLLLGLREPNDTAVEQEQARRRRRERYRQLRRRCEELHEMLSGRSGAAMGASGDEPPADLGTFTETLPVIRADVPRTPFRTGAFQSHWEADRLAESASEDDLTTSTASEAAPTGGGGDANGATGRELPRLEPVKSVPAEHQPTWRTAQADRLTNVLQAYALLDPAVGYCQGMNEIAARFLDAIPDESEAFWCFEKFLRGYRCHFVMGGHVGSPGGGSGSGSGGGTPGNANKRGANRRGYPTRPRSANVRDRLHELGDVLRRCDPPLWKHVQLLGAQECMFAFRQVVVLMARELPPAETLYLWEAMMARGDHVSSADAVTEEDEDEDDEGDGEGDGEDEGDGTGAGTSEVESFSAGDGRLFVHVVAAAFIQARNVAFGCHEFDQLLHASHHAVANKTLAAAPLLATATRLMAKGYRAPGMAFPTK